MKMELSQRQLAALECILQSRLAVESTSVVNAPYVALIASIKDIVTTTLDSVEE